MGLGLGGIQPAKNTANLLADALRSAILQGKLLEGQSLKQDELAAEFKVSKIPIREALVQLQAEGLVSMMPGRGAIVSTLKDSQIKEIYTIRHTLEPLALRQAIPHLTTEDFIQLESILGRIDVEDNLQRWAELNWEFHAALYHKANMPILIQTVQTLYNNVARYLIVKYLDRAYLEKSQKQHREIVHFCRQQDAEQAVACLIHHLQDPVNGIQP